MSVNLIFKIAAIGIIVTVLTQILKHSGREEQAFLTSLAGLLLVFLLVVLFSGMLVKPVAESYEKQKRFITDAGHEIKTPLTIIDADTTILEMEYGENEWLSDINIQTKRLTGLTNDLIYLSKMEEENTKAAMIEFPLSDVTEETAQLRRRLSKTVAGRAVVKRFNSKISG